MKTDDNKYMAVLFSPDGDYVTDFHRETKEAVLHELDDMGSRWIFYPIPLIATVNGRRIVDFSLRWPFDEIFKEFKMCKIATVRKFIEKNTDLICDLLTY